MRAQTGMLIEMVANQLLHVRDLRLEAREDRFDRRPHRGDRDARREAIRLLRAHALQRVETAHEGLQLTDLEEGASRAGAGASP